MEAAGLAIGVVGLVALVDSCKRLMGRIESFQHVGSEARPILVEFSASKHLFDRWLQHVTVTEGSIQTSSGDPVDEKTARVVRDLVSCIEDSLKTIEAVISEFRPLGADGAFGSDQPTLKKRPTSFSTKTKLQWAFSKKEKAIKGVQEFYSLIQKLHIVIPVSGPRGGPNHELSSAPDLHDEFAAHLDKLRERYKAEDRRCINQWLGAKSTESYYEDRLQDCQAGTCLWIFDHPDYSSWALSEFPNDSAKLLWLHAPAGFGKTTICAKIVESLKTAAPATTALYFFSERENDTYAIFRSWISQAIYQHDGILEIVANNPRITSTPTATHSDLERIFRSVVQSASGFTFVIDGLDECEDSRGHPADFTETNRHQFLMKLRELISGTRTRVLVVSRPLLDICTAIQSNGTENGLTVFEIPMTEDDVGDDLKAFSKAIVDKRLSNRPEDSRAELANQMAKRASGMFLWVKLHQSALRRNKNQDQLQRIILRMPEGLDRTYDKHMKQIKELDREDRARAHLILMWIMVGDSPPTIGQIAIGFAVQMSATSGDLWYNELPITIDQDYVNEEIISTCAGLVEVNTDSRVHALQHQSIRFVHSSVRDYLTQVTPDDLMGIPFSDNDLQRGYICLLLLRLLNEESAWEPPSLCTTDLQLLPFLDFATLSWLRYFPSSPQEELWTIVNSFFSLSNSKWERWRAEFETKQVCLALLDMPEPWWKAPIDLGSFRSCSFLAEMDGHPNYPPDISKVRGMEERIPHLIGDLDLASTDLCELFGMLKPLVRELFPEQQVFQNGLHPPGTRLYYSVHTRHIGLVQTILENEPESINTAGGVRGSALQLASKTGLPNIVEELINRGAIVNLQSGSPGSALMAAANGGDLSIVDMLLAAGADLHMCDSLGINALMYAIAGGRGDVARRLLRQGAKVDVKYDFGAIEDMGEITALLGTALNGDAETFELLLENGADISARTSLQRNCLHLAASSGSTEVVDKIIGKGECNLLNARDSQGYTPLSAAIIDHHPEIALRLISSSAKVNIPSNDGMTPLHLAVLRAFPDVVHMILEREIEVDINAQTSYGDTALHIAAGTGKKDICQKLLDHGADPELQSGNGTFPIHSAVRKNHAEIVDVFLDKSQKMLEARDSFGNSPLHDAAKKGLVEMARHLLNHGANVHAKNDNGNTPLHSATAYRDRAEMINLLISYGADVSTPGNSRMPPILIAAKCGQLENYEILLRHGADEKAKDRSGRCALHHGVKSKCTEFVQYLIDRKFDANCQDNEGKTAFHHAAACGCKEILELLLDHGVYKVIRDSNGCTPLHDAALHGHNDVLKLILARMPYQVDDSADFGTTPLLMAMAEGHVQVMETLIERGADILTVFTNGMSLLQMAQKHGPMESVKFLLKELHRQMTLSGVRPVIVSRDRLRRRQSLPSKEKCRYILEEDDDDDKRSVKSV